MVLLQTKEKCRLWVRSFLRVHFASKILSKKAFSLLRYLTLRTSAVVSEQRVHMPQNPHTHRTPQIRWQCRSLCAYRHKMEQKPGRERKYLAKILYCWRCNRILQSGNQKRKGEDKENGRSKGKRRKRAYSTGWSLLLAAWRAPLGTCSLSASPHLSSRLPLWIWCCPTSGHYLLVNACFERGGSVLNALHPLPTLLVMLLIAFHTWENRISERSTAWPNSHSY